LKLSPYPVASHGETLAMQEVYVENSKTKCASMLHFLQHLGHAYPQVFLPLMSLMW